MSGFAIVWRRHGDSVSRLTLDVLLERIAHRGPDGTGRWIDDGVGLGYQHLRTTPGSGTVPLPLESKQGTHVVTGDYRIDNRARLVSTLGLGEDEDLSDGELLLAAYERWGIRCPEKLVGAFAFVIWDRSNSRMVCARDHLGVKPFYYFRDDALFVAGSEAKAVLAHTAVPPDIDELRIGEYLARRCPDKRRTFYDHVERLPPAHTLVVDSSGCRERQYWTLDPRREINLGSDDAYAREFRRRFNEAVRCRLRGVEEPAVTLSGGIDSSSVAGTVRKQVDGVVHTFSNVFEGYPETDEREYIDAVLDHGTFEPHFIEGTAVDPLHRFPERVRIQDGPLLPAEFWHAFADAGAVADAGCRVMLEGWGGDQTASHGYGRLRELAVTGSLMTLASEMRALHNQGYDYRSQLWQEILAPLAPAPARRLWQYLPMSDTDGPVPKFLDETFVRRIPLDEHLQRSRADATPSQTLREVHCENLTEPFQVRFLELADRVAARCGVEPRYPFTDRRLIEFSVAMPSEQKRRHGFGRFALRNAMADVLPEEVRTRTSKVYFDTPFSELLASRLSDDPCVDEPRHLPPYLDVGELDEARQRLRDDPAWSDADLLARSYSLEHWLRQSTPV